jgi:hypothetical protein
MTMKHLWLSWLSTIVSEPLLPALVELCAYFEETGIEDK